MLDVDTLVSLPSKPTIDKITLKLLQEYYEKHLLPFTFKYQVKPGEYIELKFNQDNFCHLLGIENIAKQSRGVDPSQYHKYKGSLGYRRIKNGELTKESLKPLHKIAYNDSKKKMVWFYLVHRLLQSPKAIHFKTKVNKITSVDILFYDKYQNAYVHLGVITHAKIKHYVPSTFLIEPITPSGGGQKFITGQPPITITKNEKSANKIIK